MSAHERDQWARLDAGIDALLAGGQRDPADNADGLLTTARLVRALPPEPVWPAADFPAQLATQLAAALRPTVAQQPSLLVPNGAGGRLRATDRDAPRAPVPGRRWWRQAAQLAAALAAFGLVALVLVLVFRSGGGNEAGPPQFGASPAGACQPSTPLIRATTGELTYFVGDQDSQKIYRAAPDGADAAVMQEHAGVDDFTLSWSPDGNWFAFVNQVSPHVVMIAAADGQTSRRLTDTSGVVEGEPAWSPDGRTIAYASDRDHRGPTAILSSSPDGRSTTRLSPDDTAIYSRPVWSPDGRQIAFLRNDRLMVANADGSNAHALDNTQQIVSGFAWAPDSCRLAFSSESNGTGDIYVVDATGGAARALTSGDAEDWSPAWVSNDEFVFARQEFNTADLEPVADIYLTDADGSGLRKLDGLPRLKQKTPIVAPDGKQLAFAGFNYDTQRWEQYVVDLDSGTLRRMFVGLMPGALTPAWRPGVTPSAATPTGATPTPTSAALPTPDVSGLVRAANDIEAQALAPFPLVMPEPLPDGVTFGSATVQFAPPGTTGMPGTTNWGAARDVTFSFNIASGDPNVRPPDIQLLQSTLRNEVAADENTSITQVTLGGKQVTKLLLKRDQGGDVLTYAWSTEAVSYTVVTVLRDGMTEELASALVAATPLPDGATIVPPDVQPTPTAAPPSPTTPSASGEVYRLVAAWDAQLQTAGGMVVGPDGSVYLIDSTDGHIRVFASDGELNREWDLPAGETHGGPNDIALGPGGSVYVLDGGDALVLKYDQNGNLITSWGGQGGDDAPLGSFFQPYGITADAAGDVYVSEGLPNGYLRVQRFTAAGRFID